MATRSETSCSQCRTSSASPAVRGCRSLPRPVGTRKNTLHSDAPRSSTCLSIRGSSSTLPLVTVVLICRRKPTSVTVRAASSVASKTPSTPLKESWLWAVSLSLDGATAHSHESFRGVEGVFDATLEAARTVTEVGFRLQINTTVTRGNVLELPRMLRHVIDLGASLWSVFFLVPTGRGKDLQPLTAGEAEEVLHWLHDVSDLVAIKSTEAPHYRRIAIQRAGFDEASTEMRGLDDVFPVGPLRSQLRADTAQLLSGQEPRRRRPRPPIDVNSGRGFAFVDHVGVVYPSGFLPTPVGSVRRKSFPEIYRGSELLQALRNPDTFGGRCGQCEFRAVCGGSRSHAYATTGDPLAEDPSCAYEPVTDLA